MSFKRIRTMIYHPGTVHIFGGLLIMLAVMIIMSAQVTNRTQFANTELYQDVMERWGQPIKQSAPSIRYVETGSVFTSLNKLALASQNIQMDASMNYRKRGLVYFSGFDFTFKGHFSAINSEDSDIDIVFIFPINMEKNRVLLKDFVFLVNDQPAQIDRSDTADKLVWTGRLAAGEEVSFIVEYAGRGLDQFVYVLDPTLPVKDFSLETTVSGGSNYDYPPGVIPATAIIESNDHVHMSWKYRSLESGVPMGLILPAEKSFSALIATMIRRSLVTFFLFFVGINIVSLLSKQSIKFYELYLLYACFAFFYVLLPYLAAFMNFYVAYFLTYLIIAGLIWGFIFRVIGKKAGYLTFGLLMSFLFIPTLAIILQGYTGLIYTLEILVGLATVMWSFTLAPIRQCAEDWWIGRPMKVNHQES